MHVHAHVHIAHATGWESHARTYVRKGLLCIGCAASTNRPPHAAEAACAVRIRIGYRIQRNRAHVPTR
jgi:hypothetical protein